MSTPSLASTQLPSLTGQFQKNLLMVTSILLLTLCVRLGLDVYITTSGQYVSTYSIILHDDMDNLQTAMINQETGLRGYIGTSNPLFLEPFKQGRPQYSTTFHRLKMFLQQNDFHDAQLALARVQTSSEAWYTNFAIVQLHLIEMGNLSVARSDSSALRGKALFDQFRESITQLRQIIENDLTVLNQQQQLTSWSILLVSSLLSLLALTLLWYTFTRFQHDLYTQLNHLTEAVQQFRDGQQQIHVRSLKHKELDIVGRALNNMAENIHEQQIEMESHIHHIERANGEFRALFNAVNQAIMFIAPEGQILTVNNCFSEFFHLSAESVATQTFKQLQTQWIQFFSEPAIIQEYLNDNDRSQKKPVFTKIQQIAPTKRELEIQNLPVYSTASAYIGQLYILRDITRERDVERLKTEFISMVSHELRTPLTGIQGFIELLLDGEAGEVNQTQQEYLTIVNTSATRLVELVNDLLDISRIESGKMELHYAPFDLNPVIANVVQSFQQPIKVKKQTLTVQVADTSVVIRGDEQRIHQVLTNLVSNAHKYTPDTGHIAISTRYEGDNVSIAIRDTGIGMTPEEQVRLFTKFYRVHNHYTAQVGGSGLGLTISRSLVEQHGGHIDVESTAGQGSTFRITLPVSSVEMVGQGVKHGYDAEKIV